jgi:hypothetical protein
LWGGKQTTLNIDATTRRIEATQAATRGQQAQLVDVGLFTEWLNAYAAGQSELASFYQERFRDEFQPAFQAWVATDPRQNPEAPSSPFVMPEYQIRAFAEAAALEAEAGRLTQEGEQAGSTSDRYTLQAVILAGALLLAGLASRFDWEELRAVVVGAALLVLLFCVVQIVMLPVAQVARVGTEAGLPVGNRHSGGGGPARRPNGASTRQTPAGPARPLLIAEDLTQTAPID